MKHQPEATSHSILLWKNEARTTHVSNPDIKNANVADSAPASPNGSAGRRRRHAHIWEKEAHEHYVEERWVDRRLFDVEDFDRREPVLDGCCGFGRIPEAAQAAGYRTLAADIVDRGFPGCVIQDFLERRSMPASGVTNPPFNGAAAIASHAFKIGAQKFALLFPVARLNAAHWLRGLPLKRIWLLTPRPSMPPGSYIAAGHKPQGGRVDFAWLIFERGFNGRAETAWLHRDGDRN
jgi:hypothetical protein